MDLVLNNREVVFEPPSRVFEMVDRRTAFYVKGFFYVQAFKDHFWDGKEHLVKRFEPHKRAFKGWYTAPSGLLGDILTVCRATETPIEVRDERRMPSGDPVQTRWNPDIRLRDYQERTVTEILKDRGLETGKVLVEMATRSGKTLVAAAVIDRLKLRTLFLVQSEMLLRQTIEALQRALRVPIGRVGSGVWDPKPITVASIQTLTRRADSEECQALLSSFDLVFFDECHHVQGEVWRDLMMEIDAFWKIGLSATIFLHEKKENPKGTIWIRAALGPVVTKVTPTELIEGGYLVPPVVKVHRITAPEVISDEWPVVYGRGIVQHPTRNAKIVEIAKERHADGLSIVIVVARHEHVDILNEALLAAGLSVGVIIGPTRVTERRRLVKRFTERKLDILLGTVIGEGVDIPMIESVIVAEAGESEIRSTQRFRNLTPAPGKKMAILDDFADLHNPILAKHSLARFRLYKSHAGFKLEDASRGS